VQDFFSKNALSLLHPSRVLSCLITLSGGLLPMNRDSTTGYFLAALRAACTILSGALGEGAFPHGSFLILTLEIFCSVFDLIYIRLLVRMKPAAERIDKPLKMDTGGVL
jgi:hypothetical protein